MTTQTQASPGDPQGTRRRRRRHHRHLQGQPRDQLAALPRLPGPGARRPLLLRGGRLPALARRAAHAEASSPTFERDERAQRELAAQRPGGHRRAADRPRTRWTWCAPPSASSARTTRDAGRLAGRPTSPSRCACSRSCPPSSPTTSAAAAGEQLVPPRDDLGYAENFLWMTFGEVPDARRRRRLPGLADPLRRALLQRLDLHRPGHHLHALRPLLRRRRRDRRAQGPAARRRQRGRHARLRRDRRRADKAEAWLEQALAEKRKIMGFGHRVYKNGDSRVPTHEGGARHAS